MVRAGITTPLYWFSMNSVSCDMTDALTPPLRARDMMAA
jgi:hypothetical protein